MKNKKGFMFVETIMVMTILTTILLTIFITFSRVLLSEKRRAMFDDTSYLYRTYLIEDYLNSLDISNYIKTYLVDANRKIVLLRPDNSFLYDASKLTIEGSIEKEKMIFSSKVLSTTSGQSVLNIANMYITYYNVNDLKECISKTGKNICQGNTSMEDLYNLQNTNIYYYLKTLSGTGDGYRLIVEYQDSYIDYKKSKNLDKDGSCPNNYVKSKDKDKEICYRQVTKSYFNSVKLHTEE